MTHNCIVVFYSIYLHLLLSINHIILIAIRSESLPTQIGLLIKLETFNVSENLLRQVPSSIGQLKNLKLVNLSKNSLSSIPQELCALKQLDHLDLSSNRIEIVDDYIGELSCIELNLNENRVKQISGNLSKCSRLKVVRLEQNLLEIGSIPVCVLADSKVSLISLDGNLFTQKQLEQVEGYDKVNLRRNKTNISIFSFHFTFISN